MTDEIFIKRVLRMSDLVALLGLNQSTIYALIKKGRFPAPFKLLDGGRATGWLESDIEEYIKTRSELRK
jgi:prophage regulatory protein